MVPVKSCLQGAREYPSSLLEGEAVLPAGVGCNVQKPSAVYKSFEHLQLRRLLPADKLHMSASKGSLGARRHILGRDACDAQQLCKA